MDLDWEEISADNFESFCRDLLVILKFHEVIKLGRVGDESIDIIANEYYKSERGRVVKNRVMVQVKRYLARKLQKNEFFDILNDARNNKVNHIIIICLSGFSKGVLDRYKTFLDKENKITLELWDKELIESFVFSNPQLLRYFPQYTDTIKGITDEKKLEIKDYWNELNDLWSHYGKSHTYKEENVNPSFSKFIKEIISIYYDFLIIDELNVVTTYLLIINRSNEPEISKIGSPLLFVISTYSPLIFSQQLGLRTDLFPKLMTFLKMCSGIFAFTLQNIDESDRKDFHNHIQLNGKKGAMFDYRDLNQLIHDFDLNMMIIKNLLLDL
ncbi:MAG: hypothetical protein HeimC3_47510 [Candidatus Heimdallarchaeota archaeon LC_3]|nr:MAG: hypothetical protein HeimC3_47510 [Candidatus Heimdallarchaeota archaeon LC_3]